MRRKRFGKLPSTRNNVSKFTDLEIVSQLVPLVCQECGGENVVVGMQAYQAYTTLYFLA